MVVTGAPTMDNDREPLSLRKIGVSFDGKWALRDVDLTFEPGVIHGLVGHNGSGKSTLVRVLAGYHRADTGTVTLGTREVTHGSPFHSYQLGLRFVHQDLGLVPQFTALENFGLGGQYSPGRAGTIDWRRQEERLRQVLDLLHCDFALDVPVSELSAVQRSLLAIARAVGGGARGSSARFLVLDEPTTALESPEAAQLFSVVRKLAASGIGVVYVSHQLNDVLSLCDSITILRDGQVVESVSSGRTTHDRLVRSLLGDPVGDSPSSEQPEAPEFLDFRPEPAESGDPVLEMNGLRSALLRGIDLTLWPGECVCVVGLSGSGREELVYAMTGAVPSEAVVTVKGRPVHQLRLTDCRKLGIALVPGNRLPGSVVSDFTVRENATFASLADFRRALGYLDRRSESRATALWMERFDIRPRDAEYETRYLSGGNKQKVILAKWLSIKPIVMLVDEPTAGVDIGAARLLAKALRQLVGKGMSVLVTTSEIEDTMALADRVLVLHKGTISHEFIRARDGISVEKILSAMTAVLAEPVMTHQQATGA